LSKSVSRTNGYPLRHDLSPTLLPIDKLKPLGRETRRHSKQQIRKLAASLNEYGLVFPILVDAQRRVIAGWGLVAAAQQIGLVEVPTVTISDLTEVQLRSLRLALNRLCEDASWDDQALRLEFSDLITLDPQVDLQMTGFAMGQIDSLLSSAEDEEDDLPEMHADPITKPGDMWILGEQRVFCADATQAGSFVRLLKDEQAQTVFADPPYNVPINGNVSGLGRVTHGEFAMASGEMSADEFEAFLATIFTHLIQHTANGSIHFVCIDWRGIGPLLAAARLKYTEVKNVCVWNKSNAGMGSLYRSKHELIAVLKNGHAPHVNNVQLGRNGRTRSNVWDYPSQNTWSNSSKGKLLLHPTVKPVALIADAIRDCSNMHDIILDPFGGAGTTLIAAERTMRRARLIEIEPRYVDVTVRRWQHVTGKTAVHADTGASFGCHRTETLEGINGG
jgi:DNA modification methylase